MEAETMSAQQEKVTLHCTEGTSDKLYVMWIEAENGGFMVKAQYGRRGGPMANAPKTKKPVSREEAQKVYDKKLKEQRGKGYRDYGSDAPAYSQVEGAADSGVRPMLLTAHSEDDLERFIKDDRWGAQQKLNGKHILLRVGDGAVTGINKQGRECPIPESVVAVAAKIGPGHVIDGELIGEVYHGFDLLEEGVPGKPVDLRPEPTTARHLRLGPALSKGGSKHIRPVELVRGEKAKRDLVERLRADKKEGVVFKLLGAPYTPGKTDNQRKAVAVKVKFWKSAEFVVDEIPNGKQSVRLVGYDRKRRVFVGNCTVATKYLGQITKGAVVRVKYLYATDGGILYQPSLDPDDAGSVVRDDKRPGECSITQLQFEGKDEA
jgi:bifunctional non-homologous end joining protein LigD